MAFEKFTKRAHSIVAFAKESAKAQDCSNVNSVHLLLGMIREDKGVAASVLKSKGVDTEMVLKNYEPQQGKVDFSLEEFETRCAAQAKWLQHKYVGTEHCLLAICSAWECQAAKLLCSIDVSPLRICREVLSLLGHADQFENWISDFQQSV